MEVTVHSIYDHVEKKNINFGLGDYGYEKAMNEMKSSPRYLDSKRYEYFGVDMDLDFVWHMTDDEYRCIHDAVLSKDRFGWMAVGNIVVEFMCCGGGNYPELHDPINNVYLYGKYNPEFDYSVHGVPYTILDVFLDTPIRRTKEGFQRAFERKVLSFLNDNPDLIEEALEDTVTTNEWN